MVQLAPSLPPVRADAAETIPVLDLGPYLTGAPGAREATAAQLRRAFEEVGFYFIVNHGVPQALVDRTFAEARRIHAMPLEAKLAVKRNEHNVGYVPIRGGVIRHSQLNAANLPDLNEAFFVKRDLPPDHPDVIAGKPFRSANLWPADLPGFREGVVAYMDAMERLAKSLLPLYAVALDLPADVFARPFAEPQYTLRISHYPQQPATAPENEFGIAPHTDTSFMTLLAQNKVPGLSIRLPNGRWADAPAIDGAFLVNGGDMLRRWTNDRFLATPHRVVNRSGQERYAIPFFFDCGVDEVMECLPSCTGPGNPPKYPPVTYTDYMIWYREITYGAVPPAPAAGG
jgi:isopenicillin N synthase-like dioxygenase